MTESVAVPESQETESRLQVWVAVLIAIATVIGGIIAWRASVADDSAGDADFAGLHATLNVNETRALNYVNAYENYGAYTAYWRNSELGDLIAADLETASEDEAVFIERARADANDVAVANQSLFSAKYLSRDGSYNIQRQLGEMWADAAREKDLNPDPQFAEADTFRKKSNNLLLAVLVLTVSPIFYSLIESVESSRFKWALLVAGSLFLIAGTVLGALFEFGIL